MRLRATFFWLWIARTPPPTCGVPAHPPQSLDADTVALMTRRVYDMAGVTHHSVKVYLNGKRLPVNNFSNYVDLFLGPKLAPGRWSSPRHP